MSRVDIPEKVVALGQAVRAQEETEGPAEALFIVAVEAMRQYLKAERADEVGEGYDGPSLWGALQSTHELLEEGATDYDEEAPHKCLPSRPTLSVVRRITQLPHAKSSFAEVGTPLRVDLCGMADDGVLRDGMLFYDVRSRSGIVSIVRFCCANRRLQWEHVSDDGTVLQGPFNSPSKASAAIRGTVFNPFDSWKTAEGKTLRQLFADWKSSKV